MRQFQSVLEAMKNIFIHGFLNMWKLLLGALMHDQKNIYKVYINIEYIVYSAL